ncbi:MAG TPA: hypothetical protein VNM37_06745, partial [Candidatus Dormibacteraeota bacterium]|nr:hypothetical protein [Candidatus Dormibacteraeota bacterium]
MRFQAHDSGFRRNDEQTITAPRPLASAPRSQVSNQLPLNVHCASRPRAIIAYWRWRKNRRQ